MAGNKGIGIGLAVGAGALLLLATKRAKAQSAGTKPMTLPGEKIRVGKHFTLDEFLRSKSLPQLASYRPNAEEMDNVKALVAEILDPARDTFGPILINSGGRPPALAARAGTTWQEELREAGYQPAERSDHDDFSAADIFFAKLPALNWGNAYEWLKANPMVRQVIAYYKRDPKDSKKIIPTHIHVAVVRPWKPAFSNPAKRAFIKLDGKTIQGNIA